jgi:hypothetical protein
MTPLAQLLLAVRTGDIETVRTLVDHVDLRGSTALHEAVQDGNTSLVRLLLQAGADPLHRDDRGVTALRLAAECGWQRIVAILVKAAEIRSLSAPMTLHEAAEHGLLAKVHQLIRSGVDVNAIGPEGTRALRIAARQGHRTIVQALISAGADPYADLDETMHPARHFQDLIWLGAAVNPALPLFEEPSPSSAREADAAFDAFLMFGGLAESEGFRASISLVEECTGIRARPWKKQPGVMIFPESTAEEILRKQIRTAGYQLISQSANLMLFPTPCKFAVIAACGTRGVGCGLTARELVRSLIDFEQRAPFLLLGCATDQIEGQLVTKPDAQTADQILRRLAALSPDLAGNPTERAHAVWQMGQTGRFRLWWD